jgi:hypothetical protein
VLTLIFGYFLNQEKIDHQQTRDILVEKDQVINRLVHDTSLLHKGVREHIWLIKEKDREISFLRLTNRSILGKTLTDSIVRENMRMKLVIDSLTYELEQYEDNAALDERSQKIFRFNQKNSTHPRNMDLALQ